MHRALPSQVSCRFSDGIPGTEPSVQSTVPNAMLMEPPDFSGMDGYCKTMLLGLAYSAALPGVGWQGLVIGLGGAVLPRFILKLFPGSAVRVVELDPVVCDVAANYFGCDGFGWLEDSTERLEVHAADGKKHILDDGRSECYDMICIDAFDNDGVPVQFVTEEVVSTCHRLLKPNGVLNINTWIVHDLVSLGIVKKCLAHFPSVESFITRDKLNRVIISQKEQSTTLETNTLQDLEELSGIALVEAASQEFEQRLPRVSGRQRQAQRA